MPCHIEQTLAGIEHFEGSIPWMSLDSAGKVTVGAGMVLPDHAAAARLPFQVGARAATEDEIAADFARVGALPTDRPALFYRRLGGPELEPAVIDTLLRTMLVGLEEHLREHLADYDRLPSPAKMALLDMAHSLTPATLLDQHRRLIRAVETGNWQQAAAASFRPGPGSARNQRIAALFRASAQACPRSHQEGPLKRLGYGMVGMGAALVSRLSNKA